MTWSEECERIVNKTKAMILKKKILLQFIIQDYAWYDKLFRYVHMAVASGSPLAAIADLMTSGSVDRTAMFIVVLSSIVACLIKLREHVQFDRVETTSKQQSVRYEQLFQRIQNEAIKPNIKQQNEDQFLYWILREFNNIQITDPEIAPEYKKKMAKICTEKGIPYDDDMAELERLRNCKLDGRPAEPESTEPESAGINGENRANGENEMVEIVIGGAEPVEVKANLQRNPTVIADEHDASEFHKKIKDYNTQMDFKWIMSRMDDHNITGQPVSKIVSSI